MTKIVFISHAGTDSPAALEIARKLTEFGLAVEIDREKLRGGDSFLSFMESALSSCDYCLLLWSKAASEGKYVQVEWEAALYKTMEESRRFLLIGRLQDYPVPALLGPRLRVELFPDAGPGLEQLKALFEEDSGAEQSSGRAVKLAKVPAPEDKDGAPVYVTSELFGRTLPVRWDLRTPCGVHLDRFVDNMGLPRKQEAYGVVGVRFNYALALDEEVLSRSKPLADQGVGPNAVLWLQTTVTPFAATDPIGGELKPAVFRGENDAVTQGRKALLAAVRRAGLGF
jgi:hypothetical protein